MKNKRNLQKLKVAAVKEQKRRKEKMAISLFITMGSMMTRVTIKWSLAITLAIGMRSSSFSERVLLAQRLAVSTTKIRKKLQSRL